ncbi:peroxisomal leader peptide-processing protease [Pelobates fuscus]|uniref:peroxisomal leader peptide-processing protease n=1 Tax=Pelobates fuscus TaxID=191477 RepID=UPI002FE47774
MIKSQLLPAEFNCCVITAFQKHTDLEKENGTFLKDTDSYNFEKTNSALYHNAKTECDGQWSCSGVILNRRLGLVLCHASVFFPFLKKKEADFVWTEPTHILGNEFPADLTIQIECPAESRMENHFKDKVLEHKLGLGLIPMANQASLRAERKQHQGQLLMLVPCPEFQKAFSRLFNKSEGWAFSSEEEKEEYGEMKKDLAYLHWFAVLKLQNPLTISCPKISIMDAKKLQKGSSVFACGSPFGSFYPDIFLNTISKGVLSNIAGDRNVVLLTDARCLPGSEGGGIFSVDDGVLQLVGIVVAPLCWKTNEWVGLTLACAISHILENLMKAFAMSGMNVKNQLTQLMPTESCVTELERPLQPIEQLLSSVVLVDSGQVWGSGVLLNSNIVLTCRHVLRGASKVSVKIRPPTSEKYRAITGKVLFASSESSPYDIAVVKLEEVFHGIPNPVLSSHYNVGEDVCVVGYGAFGENCGPSVTSGILSAVICTEESPVMLQTTCAVHGGSSGGPLFATQSGELLGIVASNTRDNSTGATYPHLNFSIPLTVLQAALHRYIEHGDVQGFQMLNRVRHSVRDVWRLQRKPEKAFPSKL